MAQANPSVITKLQQCLDNYSKLINQINFTKHPAERQLCIEQVNAILSLHAETANFEVLEYLAKYVTFDYMSSTIWEDTKEQ